MRAIHARRRLAVFLGIGAASALVAAGAAYALTASSFKYSTPKTGYKRIHNMAFAPFNAPRFTRTPGTRVLALRRASV
jgi:hypothetical protein